MPRHSPALRMGRPRRLAIWAGTFLVLGGVGVWAASRAADAARAQAPAPAVAAVERAFTAAMNTRQEVPAVPAAYRAQVAALPAAVRQGVLSSARSALAEGFTGQALTEVMTRVVDRGLAVEASEGIVGTGGGVDQVHFSSVHLSRGGGQADVDAELDAWSEVAQVHGSTLSAPATPHNRLLVQAHMVRQDGAWKIEAYSWAFAPGGGP